MTKDFDGSHRFDLDEEQLKRLIRAAGLTPSDEAIHAYLIGTATPAQRRQVAQASERSPEFREHLAQLEEDVKYLTSEDAATRFESVRGREIPDSLLGKKKRRSIWSGLPEILRPRHLVPAGIVVVIIVLAVLNLEVIIKPKDVQAGRTTLAILYFENMVDVEDPDKLGKIVTNLLISDLSESEYISVISGHRLNDILTQLGIEGSNVITDDDATEISLRAKAKYMLRGSILRAKPFVLSSAIVEVATGIVVASQSVTATSGEDLFLAVDKLSREIKEDMALPAEAAHEVDRPVQEVTTNSIVAYRHYVEGLEALNQKKREDAQEHFYQALKYDSTFAMALFQLAGRDISTSAQEKKDAITTALRHSDKATKRERGYIASRYSFVFCDIGGAIDELERLVREFPDEKEAYKELGWIHRGERHFRKAVASYQRAADIDSLDKLTYNELAYCYAYLGEVELATEMINKYIALAPGEANPYDTQGDIYAWNGRIDEAIESYGEAVRVDRHYYPSLQSLGHMHLFKRDYEAAKEYYTRLSSMPDAGARSRGRYFLSCVPLYQGKFKAALDVLDRGIAADQLEGYDGVDFLWKLYSRALIYLELNDKEKALSATEELLAAYRRKSPHDVEDWPDRCVRLFARMGRFPEALMLLDDLKRKIATRDPVFQYAQWIAQGWIEMEQGDFPSAATSFERAEANYQLFRLRYALGLAYLRSGQADAAVPQFERIRDNFSVHRASLPIWAVKLHYFLGMAYEATGQQSDAKQQYELFLEIWNDADVALKEIEDAHERLLVLKSGI